MCFREKMTLIVKYALMWFMAAGILVLGASHAVGENFPLLAMDLRMGFSDNPGLFLMFRNKLILLSFLFVILIVMTACTQDFCLRFKMGKWQTELNPHSQVLRWGSNLCLAAVAICFAGMSAVAVVPQMRQADRGGWEGDALIAHACGGIEGMNYTNSVEAFRHSYENGFRTIEVDFGRTLDDRFVCVHDWDARLNGKYPAGHVYSEEEFMKIQVYDHFTPMSLETLFGLMREYTDVWIITDTKDDDWETIRKDFQILYDTARETDSLELLDRFVVQLYNYDMYDAVEAIYPFPSYILTLYKLGQPDNARFIEYCRFCKARNIRAITMWDSWVSAQMTEIADLYGIDIYAHTVNDEDAAENLEAMGVAGIYTDFLTPENIKGKK